MRTQSLSQENGVMVNGHTHAVEDDGPTSKTAIIGMACRLPGQVSNPEDFWRLCARRRSAWSEMPSSRFNQAAYQHPNAQRSGTFNNKGGHFLDEDISRFDAPFFNITLLEAISLDPQQRILLECTFEALENAGISKQSLAGRNVGVFAGTSYPDYEARNLRDLETIPMHQSTGNAITMQANRISYYFDFNGPSFTVDTACSSSLTALHLACQSLKNGECSMAVVCSAHLNLTPELFISMSLSSLFSDSGRSYAFDHKAGGFGRGEGAGCIIIKPLDKAREDGDTVRGVIAGSMVNQDGKTRGITMPNCAAQEALIRSVYKEAKINPDEVGFIEAHGTGTRVGDPLEASALNNVFQRGKTPDNPLYIGSVKTNIGHLEGASGIISVIKAVLMMERGFILPNYGFEKANEDIPLEKWNMKVPTKLATWPRGKKYTSINNFGFGGSNAHVVLERNITSRDGDMAGMVPALRQKILTLSGLQESTVNDQIRLLILYLEQHPDAFEENLLPNVVYTLGQRRTVFPWRLAVTGTCTSDIIQQLSTGMKKPSRAAEAPTVGFVFTGQGAQWPAMGRELLHSYSIFRKTMQTVDACLASLGANFSIIDEIENVDPASSAMSKAYMSQPACTAVQLALTDLLSSWGVCPSAVTGHSSGEIAAAYAAGILTLEECVRIAHSRGVAAALLSADSASRKGSMMAVGASFDEVQPLLDTISGQRAVVACVNSDSSVTVSGDEEAVVELQAILSEKGIFARKLQVDVAYHSHHMKRVAAHYESLLGKISPRESSIPFNSTVRGRVVNPSELSATYWVDNLVSRVEFVKGVCSLMEQKVTVDQTEKGINTLVEIGPHGALQTPIKQIIGNHFPDAKVNCLPSLKRKENAVNSVHELAMALWLQGVQLDFGAVNFPGVEVGEESKPFMLHNLPVYPWNHTERYWHSTRISENLYQRQFARNDILGSLSMENIDLEPRWRNIIRADDHPWIRQHRVHEGSVYPMTGFVIMAAEAVAQQAALHNITLERVELREISVGRALSIPESTAVETMLSMRPCSGTSGKAANIWNEFRIFSYTEARGWEEHCHGFVLGHESKELNPVDGHRQQEEKTADRARRLKAIRAGSKHPVDSHALYENIERCGVNYGPMFRGLKGIVKGSSNQEAIASVEVPDTKELMPKGEESPCMLHPTLFDIVVQMVWILLGYDQPGPTTTTHLPSFVKNVSIPMSQDLQPGKELSVYAQTVKEISTRHPISYDISASLPSDTSSHVVKVEGLSTSRIPGDDAGLSVAKALCYQEKFEPCLDFLSQEDSSILSGPDPIEGPGAQRTQLLDNVSLVYLHHAVEKIKETEVSSFKPHHQRLFRWAQKICQAQAAEKRHSSPHPSHRNVQEEMLIQYVRGMNAVGTLTCKLGDQLVSLLRGHADPLAIMAEDDLLGRHYEDNDRLCQSYVQATQCVDKMAHQNPHLTYLEIGAGSGAATLPILETLGGVDGNTSRFSHYTYTDPHPKFLEAANTKFQNWGHLMTYKELDIVSDPVPQGFEPHSFDVVIASNVLHATPDIKDCLANVRQLLKPGGKLLMIEETANSPSHFIYSLLPEWWASQDAERVNGPLLDQKQWHSALTENGFSGVDLGLDEYPGLTQHSSTVMVSTASAEKEQVPGDVIVINTGSTLFPYSQGLTKKLAQLHARSIAIGDFTTDFTGKVCIVLDESDTSVLSNPTQQRFQELQELLSQANGVLWVVQRADSSAESVRAHMAIGLARTVRSETGLPFATLDIGVKDDLSDAQITDKINHVFNDVFCKPSVLRNGDMDYVVQEGRICVSRVVDDLDLNQSLLNDTEHAPPQLQDLVQKTRPLRMVPGEGGALSDCYFTDSEIGKSPLPDDHIEMRVACVGLNFRDVLVAMGQIQGGSMGQECSGIITAVGDAVEDYCVGDRVCSMTAGSIASHIRSPVANIWRVPNTMELDVAASIPLVFTTAYYSLFDVGRLAPGESILIHAAAGGVGQAAIMLAQGIGAKVFATVSSTEKKKLLVDTYGVPEDQIFYSRDTSFADGVRKATGGQGVDVALNSLTGDSLRSTFESLAFFGRFVELGKRDIVNNAQLEMAHFDKNVSFSSVDLSLIIRKRPALVQRLLRDTFAAFKKPEIASRWAISGYSITEIESAFRALQSGKTIGKVVVRMDDEAQVKVHPVRQPGDILLRNGTYLITGGTRGIGLDIAQWMPEKGARNLILVSRSGLTDDDARNKVRDLKNAGVAVEVCSCDLGDAGEVERTLAPVLKRMPPLRGVIYGAMLLRDTLFEKMKVDDYNAVISTRVEGILNLQRTLQRHKQANLDFFVNLNSIASVIGNMGQAPYAASGTFMAAMAQCPSLSGIRCTSIALPMVRDVGYLANDQKRLEEVTRQLGGVYVESSEIRGILAAAFRKELQTSCNNHCLLGLKNIKSMPMNEQPAWAQDPKLAHLLRSSLIAQLESTNTCESTANSSPAALVRRSSDRATAESSIAIAVANKIANTLMRPIEDIDHAVSVSTFGMDSLVAIEVRNWITRELEASLQILEILTSESINALSRTILNKTNLVPENVRAEWNAQASKNA